MNRYKIIFICLFGVFITSKSTGQPLKLIKQYYNGKGFSNLECKIKYPNTLYAYARARDKVFVVKNVTVKSNSESFKLKAIYEGNYHGISGHWGLFEWWYPDEIKQFGFEPIRLDSVFILMDQVVPLESEATVLARIKKNEDHERELQERAQEAITDYEPQKLLKAWMPQITIGVIILILTIVLVIATRKEKKIPAIELSLSQPNSAISNTGFRGSTQIKENDAIISKPDRQAAPIKSEVDFTDTDSLDLIFGELNSLIGLTSVKAEVKSLANLMKIQKMKRADGITTTMPNLHLVFTGSAGTGKTTVAQLMGRIYKQIGLLKKGHTVMVSREDLIGEYIGHTAPKTKTVIEKAIGGVLFIDEAYSLYVPDSPRDFGREAISTLIQSMENERGKFAVIFAGYSRDMAIMLNSNQGLKSRLSNFIDFPDYSSEDLILIFNKMCADRQHIIGDGVREKVLAELARRKDYFKDKFGNAREVRTLIEDAEKVQSNRLSHMVELEGMTKQHRATILKTILSEDIKEGIYTGGNTPGRIGF